jgi:hypothetical protein
MFACLLCLSLCVFWCLVFCVSVLCLCASMRVPSLFSSCSTAVLHVQHPHHPAIDARLQPLLRVPGAPSTHHFCAALTLSCVCLLAQLLYTRFPSNLFIGLLGRWREVQYQSGQVCTSFLCSFFFCPALLCLCFFSIMSLVVVTDCPLPWTDAHGPDRGIDVLPQRASLLLRGGSGPSPRRLASAGGVL